MKKAMTLALLLVFTLLRLCSPEESRADGTSIPPDSVLTVLSPPLLMSTSSTACSLSVS